jgi:hypothetical protein
MNISIELEGFREVEAMFKKLGKVGEKAINDAINLTAVEANSFMQTKMPVVTNRLRSSSHAETSKTTQFVYSDREGRTYDGKFRIKIGNLEAGFGTNVNYAEAANAKSSKPDFLQAGRDYAAIKLELNVNKYFDKAINAAKK